MGSSFLVHVLHNLIRESLLVCSSICTNHILLIWFLYKRVLTLNLVCMSNSFLAHILAIWMNKNTRCINTPHGFWMLINNIFVERLILSFVSEFNRSIIHLNYWTQGCLLNQWHSTNILSINVQQPWYVDILKLNEYTLNIY